MPKPGIVRLGIAGETGSHKLLLARARFFVLAAGLCLAGVGCNRVSTPPVSRIPLLNCSGFPCIDAMFGGTRLRLLISLADQNSVLTSLGTAKADAKRSAKEVGKARKFKIGSVELNDLFTSDDTLDGAFPDGIDKLTSAVDGTLAYSAFGEHLLVLNIPGKYIEVSEQPLRRPVCPARCSQLHDTGAQGPAGDVTLTSDGFTVGNAPLKARLDTLYPGAVVMLRSVKGLPIGESGPAPGAYRISRLSMVETAPVYLNGKPVVNAAPIVRADDLFAREGTRLDSAVGLAILSTGVYGFDFRSMKMWRYE